MRKVVVTGATGFIGKFLVRELLRQNVNVIAVVRKKSYNKKDILELPVKIVECDLQDFSILSTLIEDKDIDAFFHCAWQGVSGVEIKDQTIQMKNIKSTLDAITAAHDMNIGTFVGCGSIHERECIYEMSKDKEITDLVFMYKASKVAAHWMGKAKAGNYGMRFFYPQIINAYGEEENSARLVNSLIRSILKGESINLSAGTQMYDFIHVTDVARALYLIAEKGVNGREYVIGSGNPKPLKEYLIKVGEVANSLRDDGKVVPLAFGKISKNVISLPKEQLDISSLQNDTSFEPVIDFDEGIYRTAKWIKENLNR